MLPLEVIETVLVVIEAMLMQLRSVRQSRDALRDIIPEHLQPSNLGIVSCGVVGKSLDAPVMIFAHSPHFGNLFVVLLRATS
jgi:hypothetical protein